MESRLSGLMNLTLQGDRAAYDELLTACGKLLKPYFQRRLNRGGPMNYNHVSEDLVQETLLAVHAKRATFDPERLFMPWLFAIAHYKLVDHFRQHRVKVPVEDQDFAVFKDPDLRHDLETALASLSPQQREVVGLTKVQQWSVEETAQATGLSVPNVKVTVHRALKALRQRMGGPGHE